MHDDLVKFLSSVLNDDGNIPTNLVNLIPENGKVKIKCAMCGEDCKNHKGATDHLLYKCKVSVYKKEKNGNQTGGGFRYTEETYAIPQIFTTQDLHRKAFEIVGYYANEGATREELLEILREYARVNRQRIRKRELEMYLRAVIGQQQHARLIAVYKNNPQTLQLLQYVRQLQMELINCRNVITELQNNTQYVSARISNNVDHSNKLRNIQDSLNNSIKGTQDLEEQLQTELKKCQEDYQRIKGQLDEISSKVQGNGTFNREEIAKILGLQDEVLKKISTINPIGNNQLLNQIKGLIESNEQKIINLTTKITEVETQLQSIKDQKAETKDLATMARLESMDAGLKAQLTGLAEQLALIQGLIKNQKSLEVNVTKIIHENDEVRSNVSMLESQLSTISAKSNTSESTIRKLKNEFTTIRQNMQNEITRRDNRIAELLKQVNNIETASNASSTNLARCKQELDAWKEKERNIVKQLVETIGAKIRTISTKVPSSQPIARINDLNDQLGSAITYLINEINARTRTVDNYIQEKEQEYIDANRGLNAAIEKMRRDLEAETLEKDRYNTFARERLDALNTCQEELNRAQESLADIERISYQNSNKSSEELSVARSRVTQLENELKQMVNKSEFDQIVTDLQNARQEIADLRSKANDQSQCVSQIQGLEEKNRNLESQLSMVQDQLTNITSQWRDKEAEVTAFKRRLELDKTDLVTKTQEELKAVREELERKEQELTDQKKKTRELLTHHLGLLLDGILNKRGDVDAKKDEIRKILEDMNNLIQSDQPMSNDLLERKAQELSRLRSASITSTGSERKRLQNRIAELEDQLGKTTYEVYDQLGDINKYLEEQSKLHSLITITQNILQKIDESTFKNQGNEKRLEDINDQIKRLKQTLKNIEENFVSRYRPAQDINSDIDKLRGELNGITGDIQSRLAGNLDANTRARIEREAEQRALPLRDQIEKLERQLRDQQEAEGLKARIIQLESEARDLNKKLQSANEDLAKETAKLGRLTDMEVQLDTKKIELETLQSQKDDLETKLKQAKNDLEDLRKKYNNLEIDLRAQIGDKDNKIRDLENKIKQIETDKENALADEKRKYNTELERLKQELKDEREREKVPEAVFNTLQKILSDLGKSQEFRRDDLQGTIESLQGIIISYKQNYDLAKAEQERLKQENDELSRNLSQTARSQRDELDKAIEEKQKLLDRLTELQRIQDAVTIDITPGMDADAMFDKLKEIVINLITVQRDKASLKLDKETIENELKQKNSELEALRTEHASLKTRVAELESKTQSLQQELDDCKQKNQEWDRECRDMNRELNELYSEIKKLPDKFTNIKRKSPNWSNTSDIMNQSGFEFIDEIVKKINGYKEQPKVNCDKPKDSSKLIRELSELRYKVQIANYIIDNIQSPGPSKSTPPPKHRINRCDNDVAAVESLYKTSLMARTISDKILAVLANPIESDYRKNNPELYNRLLKYLSRYDNPVYKNPTEYNGLVAAYKKIGTSSENVTSREVNDLIKQNSNYSFDQDGNLVLGTEDSYKGYCKKLKDMIAKLERINQSLGVDDLINDYENISGTVRIYVRINDYDPNIKQLYVYNAGVGSACNESVIVNVKPGETKVYGPFYGVFQCMDNEDIVNGFTQKYVCPKGYPQKCYYDHQNIRAIKSAFKQVLNGYKISIFGYGYSGVGKTYTLVGNETKSGIVQLVLSEPEIVDRIEQLRITSIRELYGQGSMWKGKPLAQVDYPVRERLGVNRDNDEDLEYYFKILSNSANATYVAKNGETKKISDLLTFGSKIIVFNSLKKDDIFEAIKFINNRLALERFAIGRIKSTPNNPESSRGHLFIRFEITTKPKGLEPKVTGSFTMCDMGGIEDYNVITATIFKSLADNKPKRNSLISGTQTNDDFLKSIRDAFGATDGVTAIIKNNIVIGKRKDKNEDETVNESLTRYKFEISNLNNLGTEQIEKLYILGRQLVKYLKTIKKMTAISGSQPVNETTSINEFVNKYGINATEIRQTLGELKTFFSNNNDNVFIEFSANYIREIIREGFYINESLNHMKAFFLNQKASWSGNKKYANELKTTGVAPKPSFNDLFPYLNVNIISNLERQPNTRSDDDFYDKDRYFYYPIFHQTVTTDKTARLMSLRPALYYSDGKVDPITLQLKIVDGTTSFTTLYADAPPPNFRPSVRITRPEQVCDPIGMISFLQEIAYSAEEKKPSKFIMLAMVLPIQGEPIGPNEWKHIDGAMRTLQFAKEIASTSDSS